MSAPPTADQAAARPVNARFVNARPVDARPGETRPGDAHPGGGVRVLWAVVAALVVALVAAWLFRPAEPAPDVGAVLADSTLASESRRARDIGALELARADSFAGATLAMQIRNAELAVDIEHARARTDALLSQTARSVRALPPDSLASLADRTLRVRLGRE